MLLELGVILLCGGCVARLQVRAQLVEFLGDGIVALTRRGGTDLRGQLAVMLRNPTAPPTDFLTEDPARAVAGPAATSGGCSGWLARCNAKGCCLRYSLPTYTHLRRRALLAR